MTQAAGGRTATRMTGMSRRIGLAPSPGAATLLRSEREARSSANQGGAMRSRYEAEQALSKAWS